MLCSSITWYGNVNVESVASYRLFYGESGGNERAYCIACDTITEHATELLGAEINKTKYICRRFSVVAVISVVVISELERRWNPKLHHVLVEMEKGHLEDIDLPRSLRRSYSLHQVVQVWVGVVSSRVFLPPSNIESLDR